MLHPLRIVGALGAITRLFSLAFLLPVLIAVFYEPYDVPIGRFHIPRMVLVFAFGFGATFLVGTALRWVAGEAIDEDMAEREAYLTVGVGWLLLVVLSMIPFMISGALLNPVDAFFEAMSGLTTTGATVMTGNLDAMSPALMMWRGLLQFIGGMGIVVLSVALLARLTHGGMQILQAEAPGPTVTRVAPRLEQTARILWSVYLGMAVLFFLVMCGLLLRHDLPGKTIVYEALLHTFTTIATGGFSNHSSSIAHFSDPWIELAIILFILASGTNYTLHYLAIKGDWKAYFRDEEWRFYMANFILVFLVVTGVVWRAGEGLIDSLRGAGFTVASLMTSTGFATADYDQWPPLAKLLILFVMVAGGTAGSTSGGLKLVRVLVLMKLLKRELQRVRHPHAVIPVRLNGQILKPTTLMATVGFFFAFVAIWAICALVLIAIDPAFTNLVDASSASLSAISNMGPALGVVGPTKNYGGLTDASKMLLSFEMWFGRLEIFTALLVLNPKTWRH